jgi:hypothetical protein
MPHCQPPLFSVIKPLQKIFKIDKIIPIMKRIALLALLTNIAIFTLSAQTLPVSQYLYKFSPLAEIIARNLGLEDKNGNGVIDKDASEGYEQFIQKYGNADIGFFINGITQGANNGKLEENEIVNHYYLNIRFKHAEETEIIENEIKAYIYANNLPLVWLDDRQGTVMNAVNRILGKDWQNQSMTYLQAEEAYNKVLRSINNGKPIDSRNGTPTEMGYYTLPQFIRKREAYCVEAAQFGFWFFSQLKINSLMVVADLTPALSHAVINQTDINNKIDFFGTSKSYSVQDISWNIMNPLASISLYYATEFLKNKRNLNALEKAIIYDKYDITNHTNMMKLTMPVRPEQFQKIFAHGEFVLKNTNIQQLVSNGSIAAKDNFRVILIMLLASYTENKKTNDAEKMYTLLNQYFSEDAFAQQYLEQYRKQR